MKKLFIILAIAAVFASCTSTTAPTPTLSNDSTVVDTVKIDTTKVVVVDTTKK